MEKPRADIDDDLKLLKISNPTIVKEEPTVQTTENLVDDYDPEEELQGTECVQGIAETIAPKFEEKTDESNEEISVQFKKSGRRTTSNAGKGKTKGTKTACYGNFRFGGF